MNYIKCKNDIYQEFYILIHYILLTIVSPLILTIPTYNTMFIGSLSLFFLCPCKISITNVHVFLIYVSGIML